MLKCNYVFSVLQAVNNLKEMGFQEEEILAALKATGNNQEAAVSIIFTIWSIELNLFLITVSSSSSTESSTLYPNWQTFCFYKITRFCMPLSGKLIPQTEQLVT